MKIMFASDIHGSAYYCRKMLDIYSESGAGRLVILGDILYHGPRNDLPREYAPKEVIAMLNPLKDQIYAIRGNCDTEVDQMVLEFPIWLTLWSDGIGGKAFCAHGHVQPGSAAIAGRNVWYVVTPTMHADQEPSRRRKQAYCRSGKPRLRVGIPKEATPMPCWRMGYSPSRTWRQKCQELKLL